MTYTFGGGTVNGATVGWEDFIGEFSKSESENGKNIVHILAIYFSRQDIPDKRYLSTNQNTDCVSKLR